MWSFADPYPRRAGFQEMRQARKFTPGQRAAYGAVQGLRYAWKGRHYIAPAALAYAARNLRSTGGPIHRGLGAEGYRGGAAPIPSKSYRRRPTRRVKTRTNKKLSKEVSAIKKQVSDLKHSENASLGTMTYRLMSVSRLLSASNAQAQGEFSANTPANMETMLSQLKYYDPSTPATLLTAAAATGTYNKNFLFKSFTSTLNIRNNYQSDAEVIVYLCIPRSDSSISPGNAWLDGIENDPGNVTAVTEYGSLPTDYQGFTDMWKAKRVCNKSLSPGQSTIVTHTVKDIDYDPSTYDEHSATYQNRFKTFQWLMIVKGSLSHDTGADQQGISAAGVDVVKKNTAVVSYDAGVNLKFLYLDVTLDTPTSGFVQSHQPVSDNQAYSVA